MQSRSLSCLLAGLLVLFCSPLLVTDVLAFDSLAAQVGQWTPDTDSIFGVKGSIMVLSLSGRNLNLSFKNNTQIANSPCIAKAGDVIATITPDKVATKNMTFLYFYDAANNCALTNLERDFGNAAVPTDFNEQNVIKFVAADSVGVHTILVTFKKVPKAGLVLSKSFVPDKPFSYPDIHQVSLQSTEPRGVAKYVGEVKGKSSDTIKKSRFSLIDFSKLKAGKYTGRIWMEFKDARGKLQVTKKSAWAGFSVK